MNITEEVIKIIKEHIEGHTEEDDRGRKHFVLDGFEEATDDVDHSYKEWFLDRVIPKDLPIPLRVDYTTKDKWMDECCRVEGYNIALGKTIKKLKG
jgi:hypothetical protein